MSNNNKHQNQNGQKQREQAAEALPVETSPVVQVEETVEAPVKETEQPEQVAVAVQASVEEVQDDSIVKFITNESPIVQQAVERIALITDIVEVAETIEDFERASVAFTILINLMNSMTPSEFEEVISGLLDYMEQSSKAEKWRSYHVMAIFSGQHTIEANFMKTLKSLIHSDERAQVLDEMPIAKACEVLTQERRGQFANAILD